MADPITLRTADGEHYITAELDGTVWANRTEAHAWEQWMVEYLDGGLVALHSAHGRYLSAQLDGSVVADRDGINAWEQWTLEHHGDRVAFKSAHGLYLVAEGGGGESVGADREAVGPWETFLPDPPLTSAPGPSPGGVVRLIDGYLRQKGRGVADNGGVRLAHGCSDFVAMAKFNEDPGTYYRNLDITAKWQQFTRIGWRCNGWEPWVDRGLEIDPLRHSWWENALRGVLQAHRDRGLKVKLSSFDMNNWSNAQAHEWFTRVAQIASEYGDTVWASAVTNEIAGTWEPGETDENVERGHELMDVYRSIYPGGLHTISDPENRDKTGMKKLAVTLALIHQNGHTIDDLIRRTYNDMYENYPGCPIDSDEPRGPNGPQGGYVTASVEDPDELFALYTTQILVGEIATYFNSPGAAERRPLDDTWGFKELPQLWRDLEVPEDISQGSLGAGHTGNGMFHVIGSHASRADGVTLGAYNLGVISGAYDGRPWQVAANRDGMWSTWYADGKNWEGRLSNGEVIPIQKGFVPAVVRCLT
jgi:hypothetical protein